MGFTPMITASFIHTMYGQSGIPVSLLPREGFRKIASLLLPGMQNRSTRGDCLIKSAALWAHSGLLPTGGQTTR
jgi:hypothetical protein